MTRADITVLICTHNRLRLLKRTISFLLRARCPESLRVDILVMANACNDETVKWLERKRLSMADHSSISIRFKEEAAKGKSHALNRAVSMIGNPIIAFVDDDHRVDTDYFVEIIKAVNDYPRSGMFCGRIIPDWDGNEPQWIHERGRYRIYPLPVPRYDQGRVPFEIAYDGAIPGGGNLIIRREALLKGGSFLTNLGPVGHNLGGSEDIEWVRRTMRAGVTLQYVPGVIQYHYADPKRLTLSYLIRKAFERSASVIKFSGVTGTGSGIPPFLFKKVFIYLSQALAHILIINGFRFYLMRLASSLGEIKGYMELAANLKHRADTCKKLKKSANLKTLRSEKRT